MKVMFSAGEASGDTHAASVAKALRQICPDVTMFGMGGDLMAAQGVDIIYDIKNLGYIGIVEIVKALPEFFKLRRFLKEAMMRERPDVVVCVDYPGFNMKLAKVAHELGIPVVYYIAPTIWAWHKSRGKDIAKYVSKVASIFPFEAKAYEEFHVPVEFVGHPLVDIVQPSMSEAEAYEYFGTAEDACNVLLMPGSRKQEVIGLLDIMLDGASRFYATHKNARFFVPRAHTIDRELLEERIRRFDLPVTITEGHTYDLMGICDVCLAASGTATLETALMNLPTVLLYRLSAVTYALAKLLVSIPDVGLPNIVAGHRVIPELIQGDVTAANVHTELCRIVDNPQVYSTMKEELRQVKEALGAPGAVLRVAQVIAEVAGGGR